MRRRTFLAALVALPAAAMLPELEPAREVGAVTGGDMAIRTGVGTFGPLKPGESMLISFDGASGKWSVKYRGQCQPPF